MKESDIQNAIMSELGAHPRVVWVMVVTTGKFRVKGGFITTGHYMTDHCRTTTGMSDIIGMMVNGSFLAIETKKPGEEPTLEQHAFLELVSRNGGISGCCSDVKGALDIINERG
jgi:hypothetical protein